MREAIEPGYSYYQVPQKSAAFYVIQGKFEQAQTLRQQALANTKNT